MRQLIYLRSLSTSCDYGLESEVIMNDQKRSGKQNNNNCSKPKLNKSNKRKPKGSKPQPDFNQDKQYDSKFPTSDIDTSKKYNDVSWYTKNSQMLVDAASLSYNQPLGSQVNYTSIFESITSDVTLANGVRSIPGLMSLNLVPTIGVSTDSSSPANLAAQNIYSFVRYMNSGSKNYDQADLMLMLVAMDNIYAFWNFGKRAYGVLSTYSQYNWYLPKVLFSAMNLDFDDFRQNISDFRAWLNQAAAEISSFCVPATMSYFVRHSWLYSNVFKDSNTLKAQLYMFNPAWFYKYEETESQYGGSLTPQPFCENHSTPFTFSEFKAYYRNLMDAVAYSEDIGVMSGDILKAYGQSKLFTLSKVDPEYTVTPVYVEEVLNQIHNSTVHPVFIGNSLANDALKNSYTITQNSSTGFLAFNPYVSAPQLYRVGAIINMPWDNVTPDNTMVGTRLTGVTYAASPSGNTLPSARFTAIGSEFVCRRTVYWLQKPASGLGEATIQSSSLQDIYRLSTTTFTNEPNTLRDISLLSQFDWHPLTMMAHYNSAGSSLILDGFVGDVNNYTIQAANVINLMHLTAVMSEFDIPQIGSY